MSKNKYKVQFKDTYNYAALEIEAKDEKAAIAAYEDMYKQGIIGRSFKPDVTKAAVVVKPEEPDVEYSIPPKQRTDFGRKVKPIE